MTVGGKRIALIVVTWLIVALVVSASGRLEALRPPAPQVVIAVLTLLSLGATLFVSSLRSWTDEAPIRWFVALHLTRLIAGIYFLVLAVRGALARGFAIPAGWGDIFVALLALILILAVTPHTPTARRCYAAWNILGLIDILFVIGNAARTGLANPLSMKPLLQLPLSLLPTFLVPLILTTHIILIRRLAGPAAVRRDARPS